MRSAQGTLVVSSPTAVQPSPQDVAFAAKSSCCRASAVALTMIAIVEAMAVLEFRT